MILFRALMQKGEYLTYERPCCTHFPPFVAPVQALQKLDESSLFAWPPEEPDWLKHAFITSGIVQGGLVRLDISG